MSSGITKQLQYTPKPSAPRGKRISRVINSLANNPSSGYAFGDTIQFNLPVAPNQVMDGSTAYLKFTLATTVASGADNTTQTWALDYQGGSIIKTLEIVGSGGAVIETISDYGLLSNILYDVTLSQSEQKALSTSIGTTELDSTSDNMRRGYSMTSATLANNATATYYNTFSIPLISSIFSLSEKHFPVYSLNDDVTVRITLNTQSDAIVATVAGTTTFTNTVMSPQIFVDYIELDPSTIEAMKSLYAGQDLVIHSTSYHNYATSIMTATQGTWNTILPSKVMSAKSLLSVFRSYNVTGVQAGFSQSSFTNPFYGASSTFNLDVGGVKVPQGKINVSRAGDVSEFWSELQKAQHAIWDLEMNGCLPRTCYTSSATTVVGNAPSIRGFIVGLNLDQQLHQSEILLSGLDLSRVTTLLEANFTTQITANPCTVSSFIYHDILLIIDANGNLTSKW
jgi:hypothetical protein